MINCSIKNFISEIISEGLKKIGVEDQIIEILRPDTPDHGDFSTNVAMTLTKKLKKAPRQIAQDLIDNLDSSSFHKIEIAGPGFINFFLADDVLLRFLNDALSDDFGKWNTGNKKKVQVEFVSANPTGPVTVANGRGAPLGDSVARLLTWMGYDVSREFYVNDRGAKIGHLANSLEARYRQALGLDWKLPEESYPGEYLLDIAKELKEEFGNKPLEMDEAERHDFFRVQAVSKMISWQKEVFSKFGVDFDFWFSERKMDETGEISGCIQKLRDKGVLYEEGGATWMRSTDFGDDKDFVIIKSSGDATYTTTDIAYHLNKYNRGFEHVIDIMGADHHGHIGPMEAGLEALGFEKDRLEFLLYQLVHLYRGGKQVKMSKSSGEFVTLEELLDEVGVDASRYFYLMRSSDTNLNFDLDLAKSKSMDNPVYYIQYAIVRCKAILGDERVSKINLENITTLEGGAEVNLARDIISFPDEVAGASKARAPSRICTYAERLSGSFHHFYHECRVIGEPEEIQKRRLLLILATVKVLKKILEILGVSAPDKM